MASTGISAVYTLNWSNPSLKPSLVIYPGATDTTDTSLTLFGKCVPVYGQGLQQDLIQMLENFANGSPPQNPTIGQTWYNTTSQTLNVYSTDLTWTQVGAVSYTYPTTPVAGNIFWNPGLDALEVYDGTAWQELAEMSYIAPQISDLNSSISEIQQTLLTLPDQQILQTQVSLMVNDVNQLITAVHAIATATNTTITLTDSLISATPTNSLQPSTAASSTVPAKGTTFSFVANNGWVWLGFIVVDSQGIYAVQMATIYQPTSSFMISSQSILTSNILTQSNVITWQYTISNQTHAATLTVNGTQVTLIIPTGKLTGTLSIVTNTTAMAGVITGEDSNGYFWNVPIYIDQQGNCYAQFNLVYQINTNVIFYSQVYSGVNLTGSPNITWAYNYNGVSETGIITTNNNSLTTAGGTATIQTANGQTFTNGLTVL